MKEFDKFLRRQVACNFFIMSGAHLRTVMLDDVAGKFMYFVEDDDDYTYVKGYANIRDLDRILKVLADAYGKDTISYQYWRDMARELKNSVTHD